MTCCEVGKLKVIERYGTQIIGYRGVCSFELEQDETRIKHKGYFEAAQFSSGQISVGVIPIGRPQRDNVKFEFNSNYKLTFNGDDVEGWSLESIGQPFSSVIPLLLVPLNRRPSEVSFAMQYMTASRQGAPACEYSKARFLVSNLLWHDRVREELEPIGLCGRDFKLSVTALDDYKSVSERLTSAGGVEPTAWVTIEDIRGQPKTLRDFQDLMDDLVYIFRLVTGNRIDWYYGEAFEDSTESVYERVHKYATREPYSSTVQFQHRGAVGYHTYPGQTLDLPALADAFFDSSGHALGTEELKIMIDQFTSACRDTTFLETSGLLASTLAELVVAKRAEAKGTSNLMQERDYRSQVRPSLEASIDNTNLPDADKRHLKSYLGGGYRRSFRHKLKALRDEFGLPLTDDHISRIVRTRNDLVHTGTYSTPFEDGNWVNDYEFLIWTNLIALCRLLGYRGDLPQYREGDPIRV